MFGVGWMELGVIGVIAVLVFGPERLPRMIAQGAQWVRVIRTQATAARDDLISAADIDPKLTEDLRRSVSELAELNPRRMASSLFSDVTSPFTDAVGSVNGRTAPSSPVTPKPAPTTPGAPIAYDTDAT